MLHKNKDSIDIYWIVQWNGLLLHPPHFYIFKKTLEFLDDPKTYQTANDRINIDRTQNISDNIYAETNILHDHASAHFNKRYYMLWKQKNTYRNIIEVIWWI